MTKTLPKNAREGLPVFLLFVIIVLEGYVVLSTELLAIRQTIPFVGSGTDTVSIIIAAVLMPLAFGYQSGGRFKPGFDSNGRYRSIRSKLILNIFISMIVLLLGLSYVLLNVFFIGLLNLGIENRLVLTTLYSAIFLVTPVYLLGQTIPLVSNYFSKEKLSKITGQILFFSTMGSFLGAIFSTLVLMSTIGVHHTVTLNFIILAGLIILLSRKKMGELAILAVFIAGCSVYLNSDSMMRVFNIVENNKYNTIMVIEEDGERMMVMNNNSSSMLSEDGRKHPYIEFIERQVIKPISDGDLPPKDILVIGAGAFTLGLEDTHNRYTYVDIDKSLQSVAEKYILKQKLADNKIFAPIPARAFLTQSHIQYDLIVLDAYLGDLTLPEHLVTVEFFEAVKAHVAEGGVVMGNFIISPNFANAYSRNIDNTLRAAFPNISRYAIGGRYEPWNTSPRLSENIVYIYTHHGAQDKDGVYTDNKNRVFYDKPRRREAKEGLSVDDEGWAGDVSPANEPKEE